MSFLVSDAILGLSLTKFLLHLLNFAILFTCLWLILYKPVMKFIRERQARIEKEKTDAEENLRASEEARKASEDRLREIESEIEQKKADAEKALETACESKMKEAQEKADAIVKDAEKKASERAERVIAEAKADLKEAAVSLAENILESKINDVDDALIDSAIKDWKNG